MGKVFIDVTGLFRAEIKISFSSFMVDKQTNKSNAFYNNR